MKTLEEWESVGDDAFSRLAALIRANATQDELRPFFRRYNQSETGTWDELVERLNEGVDSGLYGFGDLLELLDRAESYGNQHVYLFGPHERLNALKDEDACNDFATENDLDVGVANLCWLPEEVTPVALEHNEARLRVKFVEKYLYLEQTAQEDKGSTVVRTLTKKISRRVSVFQVDLVSGEAELRIAQLPNRSSDRAYRDERDRLYRMLIPLVDLRTVPCRNFGEAVNHCIINEEDVRVRWALLDGGNHDVTYKAASQSGEVIDAATYNRLPEATKGALVGRSGRLYWSLSRDTGGRAEEGDQEEISTIVYDDRVAFTASTNEEGVRHVLRRIREI